MLIDANFTLVPREGYRIGVPICQVVDGGDQQRCGDVCRVELRGQWHRIYLGIGEPLSAVVAGAEFAAVGGVDVKTEGVAMIRTL